MESAFVNLDKIVVLARLKPEDYGEFLMTEESIVTATYDNVRAEIIDLLKAARSAEARNVNSIMTAAYWEIGRRKTNCQKLDRNYCRRRSPATTDVHPQIARCAPCIIL